MDFDFHLHIPESSERGQFIQLLASQQHITPEQALDRIIEAGLEHAPVSPPQENRHRSGTHAPNLSVAESNPVFGMFVGNPKFSEAIDNVIASRSKRYSGPTS